MRPFTSTNLSLTVRERERERQREMNGQDRSEDRIREFCPNVSAEELTFYLAAQNPQ